MIIVAMNIPQNRFNRYNWLRHEAFDDKKVV